MRIIDRYPIIRRAIKRARDLSMPLKRPVRRYHLPRLSIRQPFRFRRSTIGSSPLTRPCPDVEASDSSNFLCLDSVDNRRSVGHYFFAPPVSDVAVDTHIENREIVWICDLGVYPEVASAAVLDHFDRYVADLKGFLAYGGLDRQAGAHCCNQSTSVHCKLQGLSIALPSPTSPAISRAPYASDRAISRRRRSSS